MKPVAKIDAMLTFAVFGLSACGGQVVIGGVEPADGGTGASALPSDAPATTDAASVVASTTTIDAGVNGIAQAAPVAADIVPVAPGIETTLCQTFANPFGRDVDLVAIESTTSAVAHDVFLFRIPASGGQAQSTALGSCSYDPLGSQPFLYFSNKTHDAMTYPERNMGYPLAAADSLMLRVYYVNATNAVDQAGTTVTLGAATPGLVTIHVGSLFLGHTGFPVASPSDGGPATAATSSAPFDQRYFIFASWGFAKPGTTEVRVTANGTPFFDAPNLRGYSQLLQTPIQVDPPGTIAWSCKYLNPAQVTPAAPSGNTQPGGQCVYQGYYYPADPQNPDRIVDITN